MKVPVVIDGKAPATTLNGSFEIKGVKANIKNMTLNPTINSTTKMYKEGYGRTNSSHAFGVEIISSGYGCVIENLTINVAGLIAANAEATPTAIYVGDKLAENNEPDIIQNNTINWAGQRDAQLYGALVKFIGNTVNGGLYVRVGYAGGKVWLSQNTFNDVTKSFDFNNPTNTKVIFGDGMHEDDNVYNGKLPTLNATLDADKKNVFFPAIQSDGQVVVEGGPLTRVWHKSYLLDDTWDDDLKPARTDWNRNAAICGEFIYIPVVNNKAVGIFDLEGNYVTTISGFNGAGTFTVDAITTLGDAVYVACCGGTSKWVNGDLTIYKLNGKNAAGMYTGFDVAAVYAKTAMADNARYGDRMTSFGTDEEGALIFVDYTYAENRGSLLFHVQNGVVNPEPFKPAYLVTNENTSAMNGIYILQGGPGSAQVGLYAGNQADARVVALDNWFSGGGWWNQLLPDGSYGRLPALNDANMNDPRIFSAGGKDYVAYVSSNSDTGTKTTRASLKIVEISATGANLLERLFNTCKDSETLKAATTEYGLVVPGDPAVRDTFGASNGTGYCGVTVVGGVTYVFAGADTVGMSLFKVN